jgi:hypothetical protein
MASISGQAMNFNTEGCDLSIVSKSQPVRGMLGF